MASSLQQVFLCFLCFSSHLFFIHGTSTTANQIPQSYIVYMGNSNGEGDNDVEATALADHLGLLSSIIPSEESDRLSLIHNYNYAFKGFSALLTQEEASILSGHDRVVSVFPDPTLQLQTTRSWDFLDSESGIRSSHQYLNANAAGDVIIGIIDTGIWPESPSFNDHGMGEIPSRWKGVCMEGTDFKKSNCNRKLIGARYYNMHDEMVEPESKSKRTFTGTPRDSVSVSQSCLCSILKPESKSSTNKTVKSKRTFTGTPRDSVGHGTHTASTAAGALVTNASYYGLAKGTARGGSPYSRLAMYKACSLQGCSGATILKAIDDSIKDGVDVISISIGLSSVLQSDYLSDPIAIGAFHANEKGIMVICAGGNDGPDLYTVVNSAPWILTVAASNIDRDFVSGVVLGSGHILHGTGINFSNLTRSKLYPLAFGRDVAAMSTPFSEASNCIPGSLDIKKTSGKIVVCTNTDPMVRRLIKKLVVEAAGGKGVILIDESEKREPFDAGVFPFTEVGDIDGDHILKYINSTKNPKATILSTVEFRRSKPAPVIASFSSRGPGALTETILKPDITAPGVGILAAMIPNTEKGSVPTGEKPSKFGIKSGTSMACPHVAGAAAFIKSMHRDWTSSMIKSALMTTATFSNNLGKPLTDTSDSFATPHEMGAGELNPLKALNPGLVYETTTKDYLKFLCCYGYKTKIVQSISRTNFSCPKNSVEDLISDLNYPSISISKLAPGHHSVRTVTRTVTNVGTKNATYIAKVDSPRSLVVKVSPTKLVFTESSPMKASFRVSFYDKGNETEVYRFGSVNWSDGIHFVRTVFAVKVMG